jgi:gas vesicle protein
MMNKTTAPAPQGIAGANAAYCQRLAKLAQESQQRWMELGRRLTDDHAAQYLSTLGPLAHGGDWQQIAPALGEVTRKRWQSQLEASQAITHAALEEQAALAAGVGEAMSTWFKTATGAGMAVGASPLTQMWSTMSNQMAAACSALRDASQPGGHHDG